MKSANDRICAVTACVIGFAIGIMVPPTKSPKTETVAPFDFGTAIEITQYPDPNQPEKMIGSWEPHFIRIDGQGTRVGPIPNMPAGVIRQIKLADGRIIIDCYHPDYR